MLAGFLINPGRAEPKLEDLFHEHLAPLGGAVVGSEPEIVAALRDAMAPRLVRDGLNDLFNNVELPLASVLAEMEKMGIRLDAAALATMGIEFADQLGRLEAECVKLAGRQFNLNSPNQLRDVLFNELKLPTKGLKKTKSGYSTDVDVLTKLAESHELPRKLLEYRTMAKLKSTYVDALSAMVNSGTGRLHTSFHQALTATGRLSSSDPNLQNIPARTAEGRRIRRAFVADPGSVLLSADYSQIELRVLAHLSGDPILLDAFASGEDIHRRTASEVLGLSGDAVDANARRLAKVINFGIIYGMGPQRLAGELSIPLKEASEYIERYFKRLPGVSAYLEECLRQARERGYVVTLLGRRRYLPELTSPQGGARAQAERIAINTPIQGTAADLIKVAMVSLHRSLRESNGRARMLLQVHDELLFEVERAGLEQVCAMVREQMENVAQLRVSLRVELKSGPNWAELS
jgi:DNA polymerase I